MKFTKILNTQLNIKAFKFNKDVLEFLQHSNWIEGEYSKQAFEDAKSAWEWAFINRNEKIGIQYIKKIHYLLMKNINPFIAGNFRKCDVYIGGKLVPYISEEIIEGDLLIKVCDKINKKSWNKEKVTKNTHIAFEYIHPFEDGNGRVGRILYNIHRLKLGLDIKIIHKGQEQLEYYKWFK